MDISVSELKSLLDEGKAPVMVDVRESHEWDRQHLDGVIKMSLPTIPLKIEELAQYKDQEVILICRSGGRSGQATAFLRKAGFSQARNLLGGMLGWKAEIDPEFDVD